MSLNEKKQRYQQLMRAMQSGVAASLELGSDEATPKHLRVGVNAAMSEQGALASLMIEKGLFTEEEYLDALIEYAEREVDRYERMLSERTGSNVSLL